MKLYFLRHASASDIAPSDAERKLTKEGEQEARTAGAALAELGVKPAQVLSSPLLRARQTAEIAAREFGFAGEIEMIDELTNDTPTAALLKALKPYGDLNEVLLVGHIPSLSEHIAACIGVKSAEAVPLGKAGMACIELEQLHAGAGALCWLMRQEQLAKISG
ncbi:MAG: phosphohistidine phosphatase SixA [Verrucomicrobiia bacterium]